MANKFENIEVIGLKKHLDDTRERHNDNGYDELVSMIQRTVTKANIAKMFGVSRQTMDKWVDIYFKETNNG